MSKKALLIGINYVGTSNQLAGCINDVINMKNVLITQFGYHETDITMMTDDTPVKPTRSNILVELLKLIVSGAPTLYFHYSGHGGSVRDANGDEKDGYDETICPLDFMTNGQITDDVLNGILQSMNANCKLTAVLDCCHSGSGFDLQYNIYSRAGRNYLLSDSSYVNKNILNGQIVMISGCLDSQTSADAYEANQNQGALTYCFTETIKQNNVITYNKLFSTMSNLLKTKKYTQIPNLSCNKNISLDSQFVL